MRRFPLFLVMLSLFSAFAFGEVEPARPAVPAKSAASNVDLGPEPEPWKGKPYDFKFNLSVMAGAGIIGSQVGFGLNGLVAFKIDHDGFLDDINDQVFLELSGGPVFMQGSTLGAWSAHLRWDFHKNETWSFYAIGGFGGNFGSG